MPYKIPLPVTIDVKPPRNMTAHPAPRQDDEALRVVALRRLRIFVEYQPRLNLPI